MNRTEIQKMITNINKAGCGFYIEPPNGGWNYPYIAVDRKTGLASPMTREDVRIKHLQLFG